MPRIKDWQGYASDEIDFFTTEPMRRTAPAFPDHKDECRCPECK